MKKIFSKNIPITISSDAHTVENIDFYFEESLKIIENIGFKEIKILKDGKFQDYRL